MKTRVQHIHFTGIGGIGMSGIAELLHNQGFKVQGSDAADSANVARLRSLGINIDIGHAARNLGDAQVVVVSSAIARNNPELVEARNRNIPVIPRADMLSELMRMKQGIAVAGSHGKTTITSLIAHCMEAAGIDPTYVIGGRLVATGNNAKLGQSPWLVAEADESDGSFLRLTPTLAVISNIDPEHLDHYGDFEHLLDAFRQFADSVPFYGHIVLHHEHPHVATVRARLHKPVTSYGSSPQADIYLLSRQCDGAGQIIRIGTQDGELGEFRLAIPGLHNAENALAAIAVLRDIGIDLDTIRKGMNSFGGIQRRFQSSEAGDGVMIDDYAHHPKEIEATLATASECWPERNLRVIFQPHRFTRTRDLMNEFMGSFDLANEVALLPIYAASEEAIEGVNSEVMRDGMIARGHRHVQTCPDLAAAKTLIEAWLKSGDIVLLMGAGSIGGLASEMRKSLGADK